MIRKILAVLCLAGLLAACADDGASEEAVEGAPGPTDDMAAPTDEPADPTAAADESSDEADADAPTGAGDERLVTAQEATLAAGSARMEITQEMGPLGTLTGEGAFDFDQEIGWLEMSVPGMDMADLGAAGTLRTVIDGTTTYVQVPGPDGEQRWLSTDGEDMFGEGQAPDVGSQIDLLAGATGEVQELGQEEVRGEPATRYAYEMDFALAMEQMGPGMDDLEAEQAAEAFDRPLPVEVWIDDSDRLVRQRIEIFLDADGMDDAPDVPTEAVATTELFDFGTDVAIELPSPDEVITFDEFMQEAMAGLDDLDIDPSDLEELDPETREQLEQLMGSEAP